MQTYYLNINSKQRQMAGFPAGIQDFTVSEGEAIQPESILRNPDISLYCLDDANKRAIFVEMLPGTDLLQVPFIYHTQYEAAQRLIAVPYDEFERLSQQLPPVENLIMVYMTGRSGSTLLSKVFNEIDNVVSLSEPDAPLHFLSQLTAANQNDAELKKRLQTTIRFCFKPTTNKKVSTYALKLRSEALLMMDLVQAAFPQAKNLYLYRDLIGWVASFYRIFRRVRAPEYMQVNEWVAMQNALFHQDFVHFTAYLKPDTTRLSLAQSLTLWFLGITEWYTASAAKGIPILPVRYADLDAQPEKILSGIFHYLGLPVSEVKRSLNIFETDAQAGTPLGRDNPKVGNQEKLSDEQIAEINDILRVYPHIKESDFIVPGTLKI